MDNSLERMPILDWALAKKLAGNQMELAKEILELLTRNLERDVDEIRHLASTGEYTALYQAIHKLHGAVAYCGTPRLKHMLFLLEKNLKDDDDDDHFSLLLHQLGDEASILLMACQN